MTGTESSSLDVTKQGHSVNQKAVPENLKMEDESVRSKSGGFISRLGTSRSIRLNTVTTKYIFLSPQVRCSVEHKPIASRKGFLWRSQNRGGEVATGKQCAGE